MLLTKSSSSFAALALFLVPVLADFSLTVNVTGNDGITDADDFKFKTIVTNTGDKSVTLLNDPWSVLTPKINTNKFGIVSKADKPAQFKGVHVKWMPQFAIDNKDFTVIEAGRSIEIEHDVSSVYDFSESGDGAYKIEGGDYFQVVSPSGELTSYRATVSPHTTKVSGKLAPTKYAGETPGDSGVLVKRASAYRCTPAQISRLSQIIPRTNGYIANTIQYLTTASHNPARFVRWYGLPASVARINAVLNVFRLMQPDANAAGYYCHGCDGTPFATGYLAFVNKGQPYRINLCNPFWNIPLTGRDSQAGCIIHELSHFSVNGGTNDITYFQANALALARNNPNGAFHNAANYQYFAENI